MNRVLPIEGRPFELEQLRHLIGSFADAEPAPHLSVRTVAAEANSGRWYNFATTLRFNLGDLSPDEIIRAGSATLIGRDYRIEEIQSADDLRRVLCQWRLDLKQPSGFALQRQCSFSRLPSGNRVIGSPLWLFELVELADDLNSYQTPIGPYSNPERGLFAEDMGHLASSWLRYPDFVNRASSFSHRYYVFVPDARAAIKALEAEGNDLRVAVESSASPIYCGAVSTGFRGNVHRQIVPFTGNTAALNFPGAVRDLRLWILDAAGEWLDRYEEQEGGASWGYGVYQPRPSTNPTATSLAAALASGETNRVEFKAFLKAARNDSKCEELLQAVVAFANVDGGDVFIGVNDRAEVEGTDRGLKVDYAAQHNGDVPRMEDAYVHDLKRIIAEGVDPAPVLSFEWTSFSHHRVLRIQVGRSDDKPYTLAQNGNIYVRTGATNRSIRRADIPRIFQSQLPGV